MTHRLVPERSKLRIRTYAEGLFARLAHDLELECRSLEGHASVAGDRIEGTLTVPIRAIEVVGTLKNGVVDAEGLSSSERRDCLSKMRSEVFGAEDGSLTIVATPPGSASITLPGGRTMKRPITLRVDGERAHGTLDLDLSELGVGPIKGPMNAFRVRDRVQVFFDLVFV